MNDEYTPTTAHVREVFSNKPGGDYVKQQLIFNRWLTAHDAATRTAALEEAAAIARVAARLNSSWLGRPHPVAVSIAAAIRAAKEESE